MEVNELLNDEEKQNIVDAGLESLHRWRATNEMLDQEGYKIKQIIEEKLRAMK